jgi:hypothetical protein
VLSLFRSRPANPGPIWLDGPKAHRAIEGRLKAGEIAAQEAANLRKFSDDGYFIVQLGLPESEAAAIDADVEGLWRERPRNVTYAYDSPPHRFSEADQAQHRKARYRIHDLHSASEAALRLYLHPTLSRYASLILGEPAVATQSLYFEYGSQQLLHRDSIVVPTPVFGELLASWIALEDIDPRSGALAYVPGSHKLPFYPFGTGKYLYDPTAVTPAEVEAAMKFYDAELKKSGLETKIFEARRGEALIWHSALMHGGGPVADERLTRKSLVVHYSARQHQPTRDCAVREVVDGVDGESVYVTTTVLERDGACGFANPLDGQPAYRR